MSNIIIDFLTELQENNNREWFTENKKKYEEARHAFNSMVEVLIPALAVSNPELANLQVKDTVFRIYRDIRFSKDKTPYKTQMGAYIAPGGRKSLFAGYYIHIEPGASMLAGGSYCPQSDILKKIRAEIYYNIDEFKSILEEKKFKSLFGTINGSKLVRPPVGFDKTFPDIDLLKYKDYTVVHQVPNEFFSNPDFIKNTVKVFNEMKKLNDFLNRSVE